MMLIWTCALLAAAVQQCGAAPTVQKPLVGKSHDVVNNFEQQITPTRRPLYGRFLHVSDFHPDPFYKYHSSSKQEDACHRGEGPAGILGAETTDCDSPIALVNATFKWIDENLKDKIDFVIWTGDSARHDNDEQIPRSIDQVTDLNRLLVSKFVEVFGKPDKINDTDPLNDFVIPIVPTWGNNDILPHNIFTKGPNPWTKRYLNIWRQFIPESQRHSFETGGWFFTEVIPNQLAVLSLNTLYFFDSNAAVDGCADPDEPGHQHMEWLRIQLRFLRQRGMKAILIGHVPPARTESKMSWDETCWQKYTLWLHQFRDVVVGSVYGHMNIDHFMLQDSEEVDMLTLQGNVQAAARDTMDDEMTIQSAADYLTELRLDWSHLPDPPKSEQSHSEDDDMVDGPHTVKNSKKKKRNADKKGKKFLKKIGGQWGERYSLSLVSPSVIPNYFPTLRVVEYNISGVDMDSLLPANVDKVGLAQQVDEKWLGVEGNGEIFEKARAFFEGTDGKDTKAQSQKPRFKVPEGPAKSSPPGPAYSPQTFSWLGYTQYYANLTYINNDFMNGTGPSLNDVELGSEGWKEGKHSGKHPKDKQKPRPNKFEYKVEYDTGDDTTYNLKDLTVRSYLTLANRIGQYKPPRVDQIQSIEDEEYTEHDEVINNAGLKKGKKHKGRKHKKKKKHGKRKAINRVWFAFVRRAFVGSRDEQELHDEFGQPV